MKIAKIFATLLTCFVLISVITACSKNPRNQINSKDGVPAGNVDVSKIPNAVPKPEPKSPYGNPTSYVTAGHRYYVLNDAKGYSQQGMASWYGRKFQNQLTSSHERYDPWAMTGASRTLPIPTYVQVTNLENGRQVIVKINDRGPFAANRIVDLSYAAATKLGYAGKGTALVKVSAIDVNQFYSTAARTKNSINSNSTNNLPAHTIALASTSSATTIRAKSSSNAQKTVALKSKTSLAAATSNSSSSAPSSTHQLYVQVGAFETYTTAQAMKQSVDHLVKYSTRIAMAATAGQTVYRVQIGPLKSSEQSSQLFKTLHQHGFNKAITVLG